MRKALLVAGMLIGSAVSAQAGFLTGERLQRSCVAAKSNQFAEGLALGYVVGAYDEITMFPTGKPAFCVPAQVEMLRLKEVVCTYVERKPDARFLPPSMLVRLALEETWPCPKP